ncbi:MAG: metallophosphoesterase family protein [Kofleriaceae bacterium]
MVLERLRGPASLVKLTASFVARASLGQIVNGAMHAVRIGLQVRRAPILRPRPTVLASKSELSWVCSLVSDTHLVVPSAAPAELVIDPGQWRWRELPTGRDLAAGLRRVLAHIHLHGPRTVLWCGDEVDSGACGEWAAWLDVVDSAPRLAHRLVPGNHDICFNRPFDEDVTLVRRAVRETAFQAHAGRLADFPLVDTMITDVGPANVVLLDSCRLRSTHVLSNAIGQLGDDQLAELERILAKMRGPLLCITHHHVWRDREFLDPEAWYNTTVDSARFVAILSAYRRRSATNHVLVCHGHRHAMTAGVVGDGDAEIAIVGLPSTTLGDKSITGTLDGMLRYGIAGLRRDGSWGVAMQNVGPLVKAGERTRATPVTPPSTSVRALSAIASATEVAHAASPKGVRR